MTGLKTLNSTTRRSYRTAILGAGYISDYHISALQQIPGVAVAAICDLNPSLARQLAQAKGIATVYSDLGEMLAQESLDVVHVLTPPHVHFPTARQILQAGVHAFIEKPLCHTVAACQELSQVAQSMQKQVGVSHNFLFFPIYERLVADIQSGRLGRLDQVDIVWNKALGQLRGGPFGAWMLQSPTNILFEVAPHSFAHAIHLLGQPTDLDVEARDRIELPGGKEFYRCWEVRGWQGRTSLRMRFSFAEGYPEHYIHVRGSNGVARVDFEHNTYTFEEHTPYLLDIDRFVNVVQTSRDAAVQGVDTLNQAILAKLKLSKAASPFAHSIGRTIEQFYQDLAAPPGQEGSAPDLRIQPAFGTQTILLAERIAEAVRFSSGVSPVERPPEVAASNQEPPVGASIPEAAIAPSPLPLSPVPLSPVPLSRILVIGATGFIGQALVRQLCQAGHSVRALSRSPNSVPQDLKALGIEVVKGDLMDGASLDQALTDIDVVYHLGKGRCKTWSDALATDVEPTQQLAQLCLKHGVKQLMYTSSIAIYAAGKRAGTITETTPPSRSMARVAPYSRSKVENEERLLELHRAEGLPVVIFRPGVVLGSGGNPYHWGIAAWPYESVCNLWGDGHSPLPIVLVEDVASALVKALGRLDLVGESFNLVSQPSVSANDYLDALQQQAGVKLRRVPVSAQRLYVASVAKWMLKALGRDPNAVFPSYDDCDGRSLAAYFDGSKARQQLGWTPVDDRDALLEQGVRQPVREFFQDLEEPAQASAEALPAWGLRVQTVTP
jgi:nucleoside-diphosphate-sugar epimerase